MNDPQHSRARTRTWILLAVDSCDRAGLTPIDKTIFHRLIFLSNCLAELFGANPPSKRVVKYKRGPFYPDVQWELDRLTAMGLLTISDLVIQKDDHGPWMNANYSMDEKGITIVSEIISTPVGKDTSQYINELVFAFARINALKTENLALQELNYSAPGVAEGALITFDNSASNLALQKTKDFVNLAPEILESRFREQIHLYLRFIEKEHLAA